MKRLAEADNPLIEELQQTIQSLRGLLEQSTRTHQKELAHLIQGHQESDSRLKQTVIKLRKRISALQLKNEVQVTQFIHDKTLFQHEKADTDKHFQSHLHQIRSHFEQRIQKIQLSNQQQNQGHHAEIEELQTQVKQLRKQVENLSVTSTQ